MEKQYDIVVIGAGNGGLSAAASASKRGYKTLLIEQHNLPGGFATSFKRGRFEFEPSLHEFCGIGASDDRGDVGMLLDFYGADVEWCKVPEAYRLITRKEGEQNLNVTMPFGIKDYIDKMEGYVPGSRESVEKFFYLAQNIMDALEAIGKSNGKADPKVMMKEHANFLKCAYYPVGKVLRKLKMPIKAQKILGAYWCYTGVDLEEVDFAFYVAMVYKYIAKAAYIPKNRSHGLSVAMDKVIRDNGGDIWYNVKAEKIIMENGKIVGVDTSAGSVKCEHLIPAISPNAVFGEMMDNKYIPNETKQNINARKFGARGFCVYLGLNKTADELGIDEYSYFIYDTMDTVKEVKSAGNFHKEPMQATVCLNRANPDCSPKGTCIMSFTTFYTEDIWANISEDEYVAKKQKIAMEMIAVFEKELNVSLVPYIEEIEIATPITMARYTLNPQGTMYSYAASGNDGLLARLMMISEDQRIPNIRFAGGYGPRLYGYSSTYMSGDLAVKLTIADMAKEKEGK
ncbi:MAG: FAD-dependent oxidoreductase [Clostridia bacterium]